jgi:uncharacterized repeat protein (TIGR02543 family)
MRLRIASLLLSIGLLPTFASAPAHAVNYTVTYYANETQFQPGVTTGSVPASGSFAAGSVVTAAPNSGNLARQGFTFSGWNTLANGLGDRYVPGSGTFTIGGNVSFYAEWTIPASARLIGNSGTLVTQSNPNSVTNGSKCISANIRGITADGDFVYYRPNTDAAYICKATMAGAVVRAYNVGSTLSALGADSLALSYGNGCVFIRAGGTAGSGIYCIDVSDGSITPITVPGAKPLYAGQGWLSGNLITFPDGRIGAVSAPKQAAPNGTGTGTGQCPSGFYCKVLRLYTVANSGKNVSFTWSEDFVLADNTSAGWPTDDHGIATDGTYLYQINFSSGYKVYALASGAPSYLVYNGVEGGSATPSNPSCNATSPATCAINTPNSGISLSNATYIGRNHSTGQYLMGDYDGPRFWLSASATPPPGPGFPAPSVAAPSISGNVYKGVNSTISISSNLAGVVRFFVGGKRISTCKDRTTSGSYPNFTVSCTWKPPVTGKQTLTALLTPESTYFTAVTSSAAIVWVLKRITTR